MNYAQLVTAVTDYCENTFQTTDMDTFIRQAEQRIYNTVQIANLRKNMTGTLQTGNKYLSALIQLGFEACCLGLNNTHETATLT